MCSSLSLKVGHKRPQLRPLRAPPPARPFPSVPQAADFVEPWDRLGAHALDWPRSSVDPDRTVGTRTADRFGWDGKGGRMGAKPQDV